jgi:hypothetical protein
MKRLWPLLLLPFTLLVLPPTAHADCPTPELPVVGCPVPGATETPTPEPTASPTPIPTPTYEPFSPGPTITAEPSPTDSAVQTLPSLVIDGTPTPVPDVTTAAPVPVVMSAGQTSTAPVSAAVSPLSGVVASSFAIVVFGLLALPLLLSFLAGLRPAGPGQPSYGGTVMRDRTRLWTGLGVLAAAAVVGGVGWYRVSGEPLLNRQIPFLASAGIVVVILSVLGGSLIIAEQLRGDQNRIGELEEAVRVLTEALAPQIEQQPRLAEPVTEVLTTGRGRSRRAGAGST